MVNTYQNGPRLQDPLGAVNSPVIWWIMSPEPCIQSPTLVFVDGFWTNQKVVDSVDQVTWVVLISTKACCAVLFKVIS